MSIRETEDKAPITYAAGMANCWERVSRIPGHQLLENLSWAYSEIELLRPENYDHRQRIKTLSELVTPPESTLQELRLQLWFAHQVMYELMREHLEETGGAS